MASSERRGRRKKGALQDADNRKIVGMPDTRAVEGSGPLSRQSGKEALDEKVDGRRVQFQIRALQRSLPAVPEEGRKPVAVQFRGEFPGLLREPQPVREGGLPVRKGCRKLGAEALRQRVDLLRQLATSSTKARRRSRTGREASPRQRSSFRMTDTLYRSTSSVPNPSFVLK